MGMRAHARSLGMSAIGMPAIVHAVRIAVAGRHYSCCVCLLQLHSSLKRRFAVHSHCELGGWLRERASVLDATAVWIRL